VLIEDLVVAQRVWIVNSVRGWVPVEIVPPSA
jgi:branched-subunit amino acid aminotransferase/4-amino-4-deoxychorismate lyase